MRDIAELPARRFGPGGGAGYYSGAKLQIATSDDFAAPLVDVPYQTDAFYVWSNAAPATMYYYRVSTSNSGGTSGWSNGSFQTVPPMLAVTAPNGGETWQRGLKYFVQWKGNTPEPVVIDLCKNGVFLNTLATNANTGAYLWNINFSLSPGSDYSLWVGSSTTGTLLDSSDMPFSIVDAPAINAGSVTLLPDGRVQFGLTAPGAVQATVLGSTNLSTWDVLATVPITSDTGVFTDDTATNRTSRFYRLRVP
jgi:hypothetical protein